MSALASDSATSAPVAAASDVAHVSECVVCKQSTVKVCSGCKTVHYCSADCQRSRWNHHKQECVQLRASATLRDCNRVFDTSTDEWTISHLSPELALVCKAVQWLLQSRFGFAALKRVLSSRSHGGVVASEVSVHHAATHLHQLLQTGRFKPILKIRPAGDKDAVAPLQQQQHWCEADASACTYRIDLPPLNPVIVLRAEWAAQLRDLSPADRRSGLLCNLTCSILTTLTHAMMHGLMPIAVRLLADDTDLDTPVTHEGHSALVTPRMLDESASVADASESAPSPSSSPFSVRVLSESGYELWEQLAGFSMRPACTPSFHVMSCDPTRPYHVFSYSIQKDGRQYKNIVCVKVTPNQERRTYVEWAKYWHELVTRMHQFICAPSAQLWSSMVQFGAGSTSVEGALEHMRIQRHTLAQSLSHRSEIKSILAGWDRHAKPMEPVEMDPHLDAQDQEERELIMLH